MFLLLNYLFHLCLPILSNNIHPYVFLDRFEIPVIEVCRGAFDHYEGGDSAGGAACFAEAVFVEGWGDFVHDGV